MKISPSELGPRLGDEDEELQEQQKEEFVAFCRVYSGRIESGKQVKFVSCKRDLFHVYPLLIAPSIIDNLITYQRYLFVSDQGTKREHNYTFCKIFATLLRVYNAGLVAKFNESLRPGLCAGTSSRSTYDSIAGVKHPRCQCARGQGCSGSDVPNDGR